MALSPLLQFNFFFTKKKLIMYYVRNMLQKHKKKIDKVDTRISLFIYLFIY